MQQDLITKLELPLASCGLDDESIRNAILMGLTWSSEYWADLAISWLEQGASLDAEIVMALEAINATRLSQNVRHRAFALARMWRRAESTPNNSFKPNPLRGSA
jgi:hypothetical protein